MFGGFRARAGYKLPDNGGQQTLLRGTTISAQVRKLVIPVLSSELFAALLAVGVVYLYTAVGLAAIGLFGAVLFTFQHLLGQLLLSEHRADELERRGKQLSTRTRQLATLQVGMLSALLRTLDLRDRMTARHSAAVARYAREISHGHEHGAGCGCGHHHGHKHDH